MLNQSLKNELWKTIRRMNRDERWQLIEALQQSLREDDEQHRWTRLMEHLTPGIEASDEDFDPEAIIAEARTAEFA
jgi:hypothetical protein